MPPLSDGIGIFKNAAGLIVASWIHMKVSTILLGKPAISLVEIKILVQWCP